MPTIKKFVIENFRGIENCEIQLDHRISTPIVTLVGLNESGKTTILEALSHFSSGDSVVSKLFEGPSAPTQTLSLIPVSKKANFSGAVKVSAVISLDSDDIDRFCRIASDDFNLELNKGEIENDITIIRQYYFSDGNYVPDKSGNRWDIKLNTRSKRSKIFSPYQNPADGPSLFNRIWDELIPRVPSISYFPTFLVDLPPRIYLREHENETAVNRHYRSVLQDVLDSLNENLSLEKHVAKRIEEFRQADNTPFWYSIFLGTPAKSQIMSVIQKIANAISKEIIGSWSKIFHTPTSAKVITLDFNIDTQKDNLPYISFIISDGASQFALHERSLGFRWFFSFLLFTRFKQAKNRKTIFLFDEPAANLHARAQGELLKSFIKIVEGGHKIIYSTHSHYMIEPSWLTGVYIIENAAINYDEATDIGLLSNIQTNVKAIRFLEFVSQNPDRVSYYQPILERLEYKEASIASSRPIVVTEGISDFHAFSAALGTDIANLSYDFVPGQGSSSSSPIISLLLGARRPFIILLDDDKSGKKEAAAYREKWLLGPNNVFTLGEIDLSFKGKELEDIIGDEMHKIICSHFGKNSGRATKKEIGIYFAEQQYVSNRAGYPVEFNKNLQKIAAFLESRIEILSKKP